MRLTAVIGLSATLIACGRNPEDEATSASAPPPAAALSGQHQSLDAGLRLLEIELAEAVKSNLDSDDAERRLLQAEAITDRLLETDLPFHWLKRDYSVEASVRQIQALADRIVAQLRNGLDADDIATDVRDLRVRVRSLRTALSQGGGPPPVSLDSLLAGYANDSTVVTDTGE